MHIWRKVLPLFVVLCMILCGCDANGKTNDDTLATEPTPVGIYRDAVNTLQKTNTRIITYTRQEARTVETQNFKTTTSGTAYYTERTSDQPEILVEENFSNGVTSTDLFYSYLSGTGYCRVNNYNFQCELSASDFMTLLLPVQLLDENLYDEITMTTDRNGYNISFKNGNALEAWVAGNDAATLICSNGSAYVDNSGNITSASYYAEYTLNAVSYIVDIYTTITTPDDLDLTGKHPVYPDTCALLNDLTIPKLLLQIVGDVYTCNTIRAEYSDSLYCEAFSMNRTQSGHYAFSGYDTTLSSRIETNVSTTYNSNTTESNQILLFDDNACTVSNNNSEPLPVDGVTAQKMRCACEDAILAPLMDLSCIASAEKTVNGEYIIINIEGNDTFTNAMCNSIYTILDVDLDSFAAQQSMTGSGYVVIHSNTTLITDCGIRLEGQHSIDNIDYSLTYRITENISFSTESVK